MPSLKAIRKRISSVKSTQKITADITSTRYYYLLETAADRTVLTMSWSIESGTLTRNVLCSATPAGGAVKQRIDASPNGYTIWTQSRNGRPLAIRYVRSN